MNNVVKTVKRHDDVILQVLDNILLIRKELGEFRRKIKSLEKHNQRTAAHLNNIEYRLKQLERGY